MSLDPNLVAAQWGLVSAFGIAVTLLAPKADQYRQDYLRTGNVHEGDRARQWGWLVRSTPVAVLIGVLVLSILASPLPNAGAGIREDYSILAAPIVAQVGFIYLVMKLVPRLPKRRTAKLQDVEVPYPSSPDSGEDTVITVANDSDRGLTLWWINGSGTPDNRAVPMTAVPPGKEEKKSTKAWHYWLLRTEYGADVGIFQAADQPSVTEVGQERVDRAWREPREAALLPVPARLPASPLTMGDAVVVIDNKSDQPLNLWWLDRVGQPSHEPGVRPVPAGGRYVLWTRPGHYWLVRTADDTPVGLFQAGDGPTVTEAGQRAVSAATGSSLTQAG